MVNDFRLKDFHKTYVSRGGILSLKEYKAIMQTFLRGALTDILDGKPLVMGYRLGKIEVQRNERNYKRPTINWGESNKYKKQLLAEGKELYDKDINSGHEWFVYFTDAYYYKYNWKKDRVKAIGNVMVLRNVMYYEFKPFRNSQRALTASVKDNELAPVIHELHVLRRQA